MPTPLEFGIDAHKAGTWETALQQYGIAITHSPNDAFAYQLRGAVYLELGQFLDALDDFNHAIRLSPFNELGYLGKARAFVGLKDYRWAIIQLSNAIDLIPEDARAADYYRERADVYALLGQHESAEKDRNHAQSLVAQTA